MRKEEKLVHTQKQPQKRREKERRKRNKGTQESASRVHVLYYAIVLFVGTLYPFHG